MLCTPFIYLPTLLYTMTICLIYFLHLFTNIPPCFMYTVHSNDYPPPPQRTIHPSCGCTLHTLFSHMQPCSIQQVVSPRYATLLYSRLGTHISSPQYSLTYRPFFISCSLTSVPCCGHYSLFCTLYTLTLLPALRAIQSPSYTGFTHCSLILLSSSTHCLVFTHLASLLDVYVDIVNLKEQIIVIIFL
jgi:hypothetical protein